MYYVLEGLLEELWVCTAHVKNVPGPQNPSLRCRVADGEAIFRETLQDARVKLTSVASTVWSKLSRAMIEAMISHERDSVVLADMARGVMRKKTDRLEEALA